MARFDRGWTPSFRAHYSSNLEENPFYGDAITRDLYQLLINWAARKDTAIVKQGQILASLRQIANCQGTSIKQVRRALEKLQKRIMITKKGRIEGRGKGRIGLVITVINYSDIVDVKKKKGRGEGTLEGIVRASRGHDKGNVLDKETSQQRDTHNKGDAPDAVCDQIKSLWNEETHGLLPKAEEAVIDVKLVTQRNLDEWRKIFQKAANNRFLTGGGPSGWRAPLAFILANAGRLLDGEFDRGMGHTVSRMLTSPELDDHERGSVDVGSGDTGHYPSSAISFGECAGSGPDSNRFQRRRQSRHL